MGATASNEKIPTTTDVIDDKVPTSFEIVEKPENIGKNKIISLLGLDDHEKYFESTDSEISELNEENTTEPKEEILYFNENIFPSESTLRNEHCKDDCPSNFCCTLKNVKSDSAPPHHSSILDKTSLVPNNSSLSSKPCNIKTCRAWNGSKSKCCNKFDVRSSSGHNQCKKVHKQTSGNNKKTEDMLFDTCKSRSAKCKISDSRQTDTCKCIKQECNSKEQVPLDTTYSQRKNTPILSKSAPQCTLQRTIDVKLMPPSKQPVPEIVENKKQSIGTNTISTEKPVLVGGTPCRCQDTKKTCISNPRVAPGHYKLKEQIRNRYAEQPISTTKYSTSYTYDEQTTESSGYTNYESESQNTTSSSNSPFDQMYDNKCGCQCMKCQNAFCAYQINKHDRTENFSDRSNKSEYMELAYQKSGEYPVLVNELESTLSQRNRNQFDKTAQHFEMLSGLKNKLQKPVVEDDDNAIYDANYEKDYCCHKCQKIMKNYDCDSENCLERSNQKPSVKKYALNPQNASRLKEFFSRCDSVSNHKHFELPMCSGKCIEKVSKHNNMDCRHTNKVTNGYCKLPLNYGKQYSGWKIDPHTGDWQKVDNLENYYFESHNSRSPQPCSGSFFEK